LGHEVIVANVRELRAISHSDRKSDHADAKKLAPSRVWIRRSCGPSRTAQSQTVSRLHQLLQEIPYAVWHLAGPQKDSRLD
jgi:hypothetical protein